MNYGGLDKKHTFFIYDNGRLFSQFAIRLSQQGHEVYYYTPFASNVYFKEYAVGLNIENVQKPLYFFEKLLRYKKEDVTIMFPDVGMGDLAHFLKQMGYAVFAAGRGDILEFHRDWLKKELPKLGLPVMDYTVIEGVSALKNYLKKKGSERVIKIDIWRGDVESWVSQDVNKIDLKLNKLVSKFGPFAEEYFFIVEEKIEGDEEPGFDLVFYGEDYIKPYLWGYEIAKGAYCGVCDLKPPKVIQETMDKLKPLLKKMDWRGFISTEMRVKNGKPYLIDVCCFSEDTEILTDKGWKRFYELDKTEKVATLNPQTFEIEYQKPTNYFAYYYEGEMIKIGEQTLDLLITPNHNFYIQTQWNAYHKKPIFKFRQAKDLKQGDRIPRTGIWKGKEKNFFILPEEKIKWEWWGGYKRWEKYREKRDKKSEKYLICKKEKILPQITIKMEDWLEFLGLYIAEGSCSGYGQISISQIKKTKEVEEILNKLPFKWEKQNHSYRILSTQLWKVLKPLGKCNEKYVPDYVKELSPRLIQHLLKGYLIGDGCVSKEGRIKYFTTSKKLANDIQELILKTGSLASIRVKKVKGTIIKINNKEYKRNFDIYVISQYIKRKQFYIEKKQIQKIPYKGMVYCVEVPNHIIYVRRNGKPCWSGNSRSPHPLGLGYPVLYENFAEIIYKIARKMPVEAKARGRFYLVLPIEIDPSLIDEWQHLILSKRINQILQYDKENYFAILTGSAAKVGEEYYYVPSVSSVIAVVVGVGNDLEKLKKGVKFLAKKVDVGGEKVIKIPEAEIDEAVDHIKRILKEKI